MSLIHIFCIYNKRYLGMEKILIVDDYEIIHILFKAQLKSFNLIIDNAYNGKEAISFVKKNDYNVIFMDMSMPYMNGNECTRQIKELKPNTQVYSITAYNGDIVDNDLYDGHLQKPITLYKLHNVLIKNGIQKN